MPTQSCDRDDREGNGGRSVSRPFVDMDTRIKSSWNGEISCRNLENDEKKCTDFGRVHDGVGKRYDLSSQTLKIIQLRFRKRKFSLFPKCPKAKEAELWNYFGAVAGRAIIITAAAMTWVATPPCRECIISEHGSKSSPEMFCPIRIRGAPKRLQWRPPTNRVPAYLFKQEIQPWESDRKQLMCDNSSLHNLEQNHRGERKEEP
ncbi:hypothetical protein K438DRAFT_2088403 [Mycena galopus ATCC 62051]|nr:hypothetical protein K438DRAFT_2088403 [Mycena galopus ATCC 62051]